MAEARKLEVINADGNILPAELTFEVTQPWLRLVFQDFDSGIISGKQAIFFCLQELHSILDKKNIRLLCNGCRYDVRPSGMGISMGGGIKAYIHRLGQQGKLDDLVDIFDPTEQVDKIKSKEAQIAFYKDWIASLQR